MSEAITIRSDRLSACVSRVGAELQRLTDDENRDLQWSGDPSVWSGRAPILFPVIGLRQNGSYLLDGVSYPMPKHGFARHSIFDVVEQSGCAATLRLKATAATRAIYPFEFQLDIRFAITDASLVVGATISNLGKAYMPASFGFHPALRWPLPYGQPRDMHGVRFQHDEPAPIRRIDENGFLIRQSQPTPVQGNLLRLRDDLFVEDALIFDRLRSRRVSYGASAGPRLEVEFPDFPTLGVWTKPGAGFICIEPWQGFSDPVGYAGDIRDKPGIIEIAAGDAKQLSMRIELAD